ncbi:MAG: response regulator [Pseudomonadota bacterium]
MKQQTTENERLVLVVVHDPDLRDELTRALKGFGLAVSPIANGREALAIIEQNFVQALIIDSDLPLMGGFELVESVRGHGRGANAAILVITDVKWPVPQKVAAIQRMGLLDIIVKPVIPERIAGFLVRSLEAQRFGFVETLEDQESEEEWQQVEQVVNGVRRESVVSRGNLQVVPFPELLHSLHRQRATGALFLLKEEKKKIVYFKEGMPYHVKSNMLSECLGEVLVRERLISEADCKESLKRMRQTGKQQGAVLIQMGVVSQRGLVVGLEAQFKSKLSEVFSWTRGEFLFKAEEKIPPGVVAIEMSTAGLIADGVREMWGLNRLKQALEEHMDWYVKASFDPELRSQNLYFGEQEKAFLDEMDGTRTLRQHLATTLLPQKQALAAAYSFLATEMVLAREKSLSGSALGKVPGK